LKEVTRRVGDAVVVSLFFPTRGGRPCHGDERRYADDPHWRDLVLFHEYFHGDTGRAAGASHQTGWTALVIRCLESSLGDRPVQHRRSQPVAMEVVPDLEE
jgi:hypothetical protein